MTQTISCRTALGAGAVAGDASDRRAADQTIRIGVLTDMAGTYAFLTDYGSVLATQFAIDDFRKQHPEIKVELPSADMQLKPDIAQMKAIPIQDAIYRTSVIREDGLVIHTMYLFEAKAPAESKQEWDVLKLKDTIPMDQTFWPLAEDNCSLVHS